MIWNVYRHDFNRRTIEIFNVFDHGSFREDVEKLLKNKKLTKEEFEEKLKRLTKYCYWSKCEHEVVITSWCPYISKEELDRLNKEDIKYRTSVNLTVGKKIDIYDQLNLNWNSFVEYVYGFRKVGKK